MRRLSLAIIIPAWSNGNATALMHAGGRQEISLTRMNSIAAGEARYGHLHRWFGDNTSTAHENRPASISANYYIAY